jgi:CubicO group peptidase (beta-lactamase class C family)
MRQARISHTFLASTVAVFWSCHCPAADSNLENGIERVIVEEGLTGIAWSLVRDNGEVTLGSAGVQDRSTGVAFAPDTRFHVGSLTKALLATGVLRLATEGRINLDTPVLRYLPDLFSDKPPARFSGVEVRHLLDHTAGLNDAHMWQVFSERADPDGALSSAFPDPESQLRVRSRPGARFSYSNIGYTLLGMIIESIVGVRYETYLDEHLLAPLGMHDSTFAFTTQEGEDANPMLAWGHVDDGSRYAASPIFLRPAGQFTTTTADLARFAQFLLGDGVVDGRTFIDESLMRSRAKPFGTEAANEGLIAGYALGLGRRDRHGVVGYCHGGNIVGFVAMLCIFPDEQKAFAYSVNTDSEVADYGRLDSVLIEALDIARAATPQSASRASDISEWQGRYVLSPNRFQTFKYLDTVFGSIRISADGDILTLASMQKEARQLRPVGQRFFSANDRSTTSHVFYRGENGEYLVSDGFLTFEKSAAAYLIAHWTSIALGLAGLAWILISGSVSLIRYRFKIFQRPEAPAFVASALLFTPIPFFFAQSFIALGDPTFASGLLAAVTLLLPIGMLLTVLLAKKTWKTTRIDLLNGAAAALVLQWCVVLGAAGMLPFRLWA